MSDSEECLINVAVAAQHYQDAVIAAAAASRTTSTSSSSSSDTDDPTPMATTAAPIAASTATISPVVPIESAELSSGSSSEDDDSETPPKRQCLQAPLPPPEATAAAATPTAATTSTVVASHYNTLAEKGLAARAASRIFHMRNFNNWIKSQLINEYISRIRDASKLGAPLRVLDMCCGKGGDLYKWEKAHITHLICTDIAAVSVEQCESRYRALTARHENSQGVGGGKHFSAEFFACDATRTRLRHLYRDASVELQLVSCQFAFHYCFESLQQAECMIKNAAECLQKGGYFIGTMPDAYELVRRQREAVRVARELAGGDGVGAKFGNELYEVGFLCDAEQPPLFGGKYNFQLHGVVDCPEFLVHFPLLVKLARKYGLELVMRESFGGYFRKMIETSKGLLEKMNGLQTYPGHEHSGANRTPEVREQFGHADEFLAAQNDGQRYRKCGTLSKAEWEATSIYMVFAFQKLEKKYDQKGELYFD